MALPRSHSLLVVALVAALACRPHPADRPSDVDTTATSPPGDTADVVEDYPLTTAQDTVTMAKLRRPARVVPTGGIVNGYSGLPVASWCTGPYSGSVQSAQAKFMLATVKAAAKCGLVVVVPYPRSNSTTNGSTTGCWSLDRFKTSLEGYRRYFPPDSAAKYSRSFYWQLMDDMTSTHAYPGPGCTIDQREAAAAFAAVRAIYGNRVSLVIRGTPDYLLQAPGTDWKALVDAGVAQWHERKRQGQADYYRSAAAGAAKLGIKMFYGWNQYFCAGEGTSACSADKISRYGQVALAQAGNCGMLPWKMDDWYSGDRKTAALVLSSTASRLQRVDCHRTT